MGKEQDKHLKIPIYITIAVLSLVFLGFFFGQGPFFTGMLNGSFLRLRQPLEPTIPTIAINEALKLRNSFINNQKNYTNDPEKITFIVNKRLSKLYPNWKENATKLIDEYNKILAINTTKQLEIGQFLVTDNDNDVCHAQEHPEFYLSNGTYGGLTIFYMVFDKPVSLDCSLFFNGAVLPITDENLKETNYGVAYLLPAYDPNIKQPNVYILGNLAHEVGHAYGLGIPEYYQYFDGFIDNPSGGLKTVRYFKDITGVEPNLGNYAPYFITGGTTGRVNDPMASGEAIAYNSLNSFILNHNGNHYFGPSTIGNMIQKMKVRVYIKAQNGIAIPNTKINVYGMVTNTYPPSYEDYHNQKIIETEVTDVNGLAEVSLPSSTVIYGDPYNPNRDFLVKAVKVNVNGVTAGAFYSSVDLLNKLLVEGKSSYDIVLNI